MTKELTVFSSQRTIREIMDSGDWERFCEAFGYNQWMVNEGRAFDDETLHCEVVPKAQAESLLSHIEELEREMDGLANKTSGSVAELVASAREAMYCPHGCEKCSVCGHHFARLQRALEAWEEK